MKNPFEIVFGWEVQLVQLLLPVDLVIPPVHSMSKIFVDIWAEAKAAIEHA